MFHRSAGEKNSLEQLLSAANTLQVPGPADNDELLDAWRYVAANGSGAPFVC